MKTYAKRVGLTLSQEQDLLASKAYGALATPHLCHGKCDLHKDKRTSTLTTWRLFDGLKALVP